MTCCISTTWLSQSPDVNPGRKRNVRQPTPTGTILKPLKRIPGAYLMRWAKRMLRECKGLVVNSNTYLEIIQGSAIKPS